MSNNLKQFLADLEKETEQVKTELNQEIKGTAEAVQGSLLSPKGLGGTPKQTGNLRANWIVTVDSMYSGLVGSKENVDTSTRDSNWSSFLNLQDLYSKSNIYWNNNVEYGEAVNYGTPTIAAQNFRETAIQAGEVWIRGNKK